MIIEESFGSELATICSHYTKIVRPLLIHSCSPSSVFSRLADFFAASMKESALGTAWDEANMQQPCRLNYNLIYSTNQAHGKYTEESVFIQ